MFSVRGLTVKAYPMVPANIIVFLVVFITKMLKVI